jgi:hypothetical protein
MKISESEIELVSAISRAENVAYADRMRRRFGSSFPKLSKLESSPLLEKLESEGWEAVYAPETWGRNFLPMIRAILNVGYGFSQDAVSGALALLARRTGLMRSCSSLGVVESIFTPRGDKPHAVVRIPHSGGGYSRHQFRIVSSPEFVMSLGQPVEFIPPCGRIRPRLRPLSPPSAVGVGGELKHLSLFELVSVVMGQSAGMDFVGLWEKKRLPVSHLGSACLKQDLASLYVHEATGEGILVFRGTRPLSLKDWVVNIKTTHDVASSHHAQALATTLAAGLECKRLMLVGYSKGGGLAQFAAAKTGCPAITLNSVGLPNRLVEELALSKLPTIEHFMTKYDAVSNLGGTHSGKISTIAGPWALLRGMRQNFLGCPPRVHVLPSISPRNRVWSLHSLSEFREVLREHPLVIPDPTLDHRKPSYALSGIFVNEQTGDFVYEPRSSSTSVGKTTRKTRHRSTPVLSKKTTAPSPSSNSTSSKFL